MPPTADPLPDIVGSGAAMAEVYRVVRRVAAARASVLLVGETGTGKELLARAVHRLSARAEGPYVRVNCGALAESLLESELFGHVKGAFTGAIDNKTGRFEAAHTGTIFLDEVNSMSSKLQLKLLRVLQEREFERVGDHRTVKVDTRVVAATNAALEDEVAAGRFREDLYYRLNVVPIHLPPLRERREDIPALAAHFLTRYAKEAGKAGLAFGAGVLPLLQAHSWRGNVRELENVIERMVVLADGAEATRDLLPPEVRGEPPTRIVKARGFDTKAAVRDFVRQALRDHRADDGGLYDTVVGAVERELIEQALAEAQQVQVKAALRLGISRNTLHKKLKEQAGGASADELEDAG